MIVMALVALFGLFAVVLLYFFFVSRGAAQRDAVRKDLEEEVALKLRKAQEIDAGLADQVAGGAPVNQAVAKYQGARAAVLASDKTEEPWRWGGDDLEAWKRRESSRRIEDVNRRLLLPALGLALLVVTLTTASEAVYYGFVAATVTAPSAGLGRPPSPMPPAASNPTAPPIFTPDPDNPDAPGRGATPPASPAP